MKPFLVAAIALGVFAAACSTAAPIPSTPIPAPVPTPTAAPSPTPVLDRAQSRGGSALSVWASPDAAYLALYDPRLAASKLKCTIQPFTDVIVAERNVGWASYQLSDLDKATIHTLSFASGTSSDVVGRVASMDGRCAGFVSAALLTSP